MKKKTTIIVLGVIIVLLLINNLAYYNFSKKLQQEVVQLKTSSDKLEENFKVLKKNYEFLKKENIEVKEESVSVSREMEQVESTVDKTLDKLNNFEIAVSDSINWFRANNNVANLESYSEIKEELKEACLITGDMCTVDLTCMYKVNHKNMFRYGYDDYSTGKKDFLKDLDSIYTQYGGDCEDFSLLFTAEYNYLIDQCLVNYTREEVVTSVRKDEVNITINGPYMYIICGNLDPKEIVKDYAGHCLVALAENPIQKSSDVYPVIKDSILVEPQNGQFVANMSDTDIIQIFDNGVAPDTYFFIYMAIIEDDLIIFDEYADEIEWIGYEDFIEDIDKLKKDVEK